MSAIDPSFLRDASVLVPVAAALFLAGFKLGRRLTPPNALTTLDRMRELESVRRNSFARGANYGFARQLDTDSVIKTTLP